MTDSANSNRLPHQAHTLLLATDSKNSVLAEVVGGKLNPIAYSAYGKQSAQQVIASQLGFNGELRESQIGWYLLGKGYRAFNPTLMRFHSPDSWSPFGTGGLNAYMYCVGDPVNASDPTGHMPLKPFKFFSRTTVRQAPSTSSLAPLIPANGTPTLTRAGTRPATSVITPTTPSRSTVSELPAMRRSESTTQPRDPSTGENIYGLLPPGRRHWIAPSSSPPPNGMMTYEEMAQRQGYPVSGLTSGSVNQPHQGPSVDRSTKPNLLKPTQRPLPLTPDAIAMGFSIDSNGVERVDLKKYTNYTRQKT
jgi:RHS repeat-associated protein